MGKSLVSCFFLTHGVYTKRWWCGYLSGARCRLFAYGPADATAVSKSHHLLPHLNPDWFTFLVPAYPGCPGKEAVKWVRVRACVWKLTRYRNCWFSLLATRRVRVCASKNGHGDVHIPLDAAWWGTSGAWNLASVSWPTRTCWCGPGSERRECPCEWRTGQVSHLHDPACQ